MRVTRLIRPKARSAHASVSLTPPFDYGLQGQSPKGESLFIAKARTMGSWLCGFLSIGGCLLGGFALAGEAALFDLAERLGRRIGNHAIDVVRQTQTAGPAGVAVGPVPPLIVAVREAGFGHDADQQLTVRASRIGQ